MRDDTTIHVSVSTATDGGAVGVQLPNRGNALLNTPRMQGLPDTSVRSNPHKYLIETNPVLTDLKQFMSSDYLLTNLGYDPDIAAKRLGDGFFEQRLIQQAVVERTGQRFIDGQTSDEAMFKYLMNNAIASKDELNLSVGVTLTAQQVAALTHDIVWLEEHEVNGEKVLVPVLYLAQADNRLAPNGALIQGGDVTLIAGQDLNNAGTLRATNNLAASAGQDLTNSGLIEAGNRLDLLAGNNIINKSGGVIAGRDVTLTAVKGDVINERTVTTTDFSSKGYTQQRDYLDSAARIEAANDLSISAGRDVLSTGSVLSSGRDTEIQAGRDINITSTEQQSADTGGRQQSSITQFGSSLNAGRDITLSAGRDINIVASELEAKRNIGLAAQGDATVASGADESHSYYKSKKFTAQEDHVKQVSSAITAGGDVAMSAGNDLTFISSRITAGDEAYLVAGNNIELLAAQDTDYSLYDKKSKGSFGQKASRRDEVTDVVNVGSQITTGGDLTLASGGDQRYQGAKLNSGGDLTLDSGGSITFEAVKDLHDESHTKSDGDGFWTSSKGKGNTDETLRQTQMIASGNIVIKAVDGLKIDIKQVDEQTVGQTIDAMVKADPQLAWLQEAEARGDVDWRLVKEIHESFKYSNSGLGPASQLIIAIVMATFVGPMAMEALTASMGTVGAAGLAAVATGAATNATTSFINNGGNLGAVFKDVTSKDALKSYVIAAVTAGMTQGYFGDLTGTTTDSITGKIVFSDPSVTLGSLEGIGRFAANQALQNGTATALSKIMGQGGNLGDALKTTLYNTLAAASFNAVGDYTKDVFADGSAQKVMIHAMVGGLLAEVSGGDFKTGALAAGANEALVVHLNTLVGGNKDLLIMTSQLVGVLAAATQKEAGIDSLNSGKWVAENATKYNFLSHQDVSDLKEALADCQPKGNCDDVRADFQRRDAANKARLDSCKTNCADIWDEVHAGSIALTELWKTDDTGITDRFLTSNINDMTRAGTLVAGQVGLAAWDGESDALSQIGRYLDQQGFNPFGINPAALAGLGGSGKTSYADGVVGASKNGGETPKNFNPSSPLIDAEVGHSNLPKVPIGEAKANVGSISHVSGVDLSKSQSKMIADFEAAGYPSKPVVSPTSGNVVGTQYTLPDGSRVRVMQADGRSPQRASFENANGGPVDPTTGKPPQPPQGLSKAERKQWIRERTHIEQVD